MSIEAVNWALAQKLDRSSAKFVLVAMANCANEGMTCWPSIGYLSDATCQDRKTVLENIKRLKDIGIIQATDERRGKTGQVTVYLIDQEYQKRDPSTVPKTGHVPKVLTVPKTDGKSPVFPIKESRFSAETVPKTGHGTIREPSKEPSGNHKTAAGDGLFPDLPPAVDPDSPPTVHELVAAGMAIKTAVDFIAYKAKAKAPLTRRAWVDHKREAEKAGWSAGDAADKVMAKSWKGFEAKYVANERSPPAAPKHSGFASKDYRQGVEEDGTFA